MISYHLLRDKFSLSDSTIRELARIAIRLEEYYEYPLDIEWAISDINDRIYILQVRPETVKNNINKTRITTYEMVTKGKLLTSGHAIGESIGTGRARIIRDIGAAENLREGDILITDMTDPGWEPLMKKSAAIIPLLCTVSHCPLEVPIP